MVSIEASVLVCIGNFFLSVGEAKCLIRATVPRCCLAKRAGQCSERPACLCAKSFNCFYQKHLTAISNRSGNSCFQGMLGKERHTFRTLTNEVIYQWLRHKKKSWWLNIWGSPPQYAQNRRSCLAFKTRRMRSPPSEKKCGKPQFSNCWLATSIFTQNVISCWEKVTLFLSERRQLFQTSARQTNASSNHKCSADQTPGLTSNNNINNDQQVHYLCLSAPTVVIFILRRNPLEPISHFYRYLRGSDVALSSTVWKTQDVTR